MLNYSILMKKPAYFRNFSGLELDEFNTINLQIKEKYDAYEEKRLREETEKEQLAQAIPSSAL